MLNQGLNLLRDLHYDDLDTGEAGTDGTAFDATQTGLITAVSATEQPLVKTKSDKSLQITWRLPGTVGTGNTYREFVTQNSSDEEYDRSVFPGVAHTANDEIVVVKTYGYRQA